MKNDGPTRNCSCLRIDPWSLQSPSCDLVPRLLKYHPDKNQHNQEACLGALGPTKFTYSSYFVPQIASVVPNYCAGDDAGVSRGVWMRRGLKNLAKRCAVALANPEHAHEDRSCEKIPFQISCSFCFVLPRPERFLCKSLRHQRAFSNPFLRLINPGFLIRTPWRCQLLGCLMERCFAQQWRALFPQLDDIGRPWANSRVQGGSL